MHQWLRLHPRDLPGRVRPPDRQAQWDQPDQPLPASLQDLPDLVHQQVQQVQSDLQHPSDQQGLLLRPVPQDPGDQLVR